MKSENIKLRQFFISTTTFEYTSNLQFRQKSLSRKENLCRQTCFFLKYKINHRCNNFTRHIITVFLQSAKHIDLCFEICPSHLRIQTSRPAFFLAVRQVDSRLVRNSQIILLTISISFLRFVSRLVSPVQS